MIVLLALAVVLAGVLVYTVRRSFPQVDGSLRLPGLSGSVEIYRDKSGIPHIYADTAADLFMAQGFVHAQDRFYEMDFRRHLTAGRLSEVYGAATLDNDKALRTMGWRRVAEQELPELAQETRDFLAAYAKGVNAWLAANPNASDRSLEYSLLKLQGSGGKPEKWTPVDSLAWLKAMAWDLRSNMEDEIDRALALTKLPRERVEQLYPGYPFDRHAPIVNEGGIRQGRFEQRPPQQGPQQRPQQRTRAARALTQAAKTLSDVPETMSAADRAGIGSNSWVVSGEYTEGGKPLLANDPHLAPNMPSVWYQAGLHCRKVSEECPYDVTGFTFSGVPGVIIGHTDKIAWGGSRTWGPTSPTSSLSRWRGTRTSTRGSSCRWTSARRRSRWPAGRRSR
ncbi:hypothetical protein GCM10020001_031750 [Nonomuraea salmonea]